MCSVSASSSLTLTGFHTGESMFDMVTYAAHSSSRNPLIEQIVSDYDFALEKWHIGLVQGNWQQTVIFFR